MMDLVWHFIDISVPWWVKLVAAALVVGVLLAFFRAYWKYILAGAAVVGGAILLNRAKQQGYAQRKTDEQVAEKKAETVVVQQQDKAQSESDAELQKGVDKWTR